MAARLFALIIGINHYQSKSICDLHACVEDANRMERYLSGELYVPRDQIRVLVDRQATKQAIEDSFMEHLTNNHTINRGDAIVIYFAGHGSVIPAPRGWFQGSLPVSNGVQVLCPYDHNTKRHGERVSGISDRSIHALIHELSQSKGDNITFITDCCFSPPNSLFHNRGRSRVRWTPTTKVKPDDLYLGLWPGARGLPHEGFSFYYKDPGTHIFLSACSPDGEAVERRGGGRFTSNLLQAASELVFHRTSYEALIDHLNQMPTSENQRPWCTGQNKARVVFDALPFVVDAGHILSVIGHAASVRVEAGAIQGIVEGTELSLHLHNYRSSQNPQIATILISDVHPTWSLGSLQSSGIAAPKVVWAKITRWNIGRPFRVHLQATIMTLYQKWKVRRNLCSKTLTGCYLSKSGFDIACVSNSSQADMTMRIGFHKNTVELHNMPSCSLRHRAVLIDEHDILDTIDKASRFHMHFHCRNPEYPLKDLVTMELFRLDPSTWINVGSNLLDNGGASIPYEKGEVFTMIINNRSDMDLWPYLLHMDPDIFRITILYQPEQPSIIHPLPRHARLRIGTGRPGSEALSFMSPESRLGSVCLKLLLSPEPISTGMIEQESTLSSLESVSGQFISLPLMSSVLDQTWDTISACILLEHR